MFDFKPYIKGSKLKYTGSDFSRRTTYGPTSIDEEKFIQDLIIFLQTDEGKIITTLDLRNNHLSGKGISLLAHYLGTNTTVKKLKLANNYIFSDSLIALSNMLETNNCLETLDISKTQHTYTVAGGNSEMGNIDIKALAKALKTNFTLITLDMTNLIGERIAKEAAVKLALAISKHNYTIREIHGLLPLVKGTPLEDNLLTSFKRNNKIFITQMGVQRALSNFGIFNTSSLSTAAIQAPYPTSITLPSPNQGKRSMGDSGQQQGHTKTFRPGT